MEAPPVPVAADSPSGWRWGGLGRQLLRRLPLMLLSFLPAWVVHTYLLVVKNEGYRGFDHWSAPYLNVEGNGLTAGLAFGLSSGALWSILFSLWRPGPKATLNLVLGAPGRCLAVVRTPDASTRLGVALGTALVLLGSEYLGLRSTSRLWLGGGCLLWCGSYAGTLLVSLLTRASAPLKSKFPWLAGLDLGSVARALVATLPLAWLGSWLLGFWWSSKLGWLALLYAAYSLYERRGKAPTAVPGLLVVIGWWLLFTVLAQNGWADDGGWAEATGGGGLTKDNILKWWTSVGSGKAIGQGLLPALGAALGSGLAPPLDGEDPNRIIGYVLNLSADRFSLEAGQPASLTVSVWSVTAAGAQAPASGAEIQLSPPACPGLVVQPTSGTCSFTASLVWEGGSPPSQTLVMAVSASAGGSLHQASVSLNLAGGYELVVTVYSEPFS